MRLVGPLLVAYLRLETSSATWSACILSQDNAPHTRVEEFYCKSYAPTHVFIPYHLGHVVGELCVDAGVEWSAESQHSDRL